MVASPTTPLFITLLSALAFGSPVLFLRGATDAQATPVAAVAEELAEFTPPDDAQVDGDTIITSTGTYFRPPTDRRPRSGHRTTTGTRGGGCLSGAATAFAALGPKDDEDVVGQTVSSRPTFVWYLPEIEREYPVMFRLLAPNADGVPVPIYSTRFDYRPGFVSHQLPVAVAALSPEIEYRWQVIVECNPSRPAQSVFQELSFEVVSPTPDLSQAVADAATDAERAIAYGQGGAWYDAIATVATATGPSDLETRTGLLRDLAASLPESDAMLRQDILDIVAATSE